MVESGADLADVETQDEFSVLDRAGRLQLPHEMLEGLGLDDNKVKLSVKDGQIVISKP